MKDPMIDGKPLRECTDDEIRARSARLTKEKLDPLPVPSPIDFALEAFAVDFDLVDIGPERRATLAWIVARGGTPLVEELTKLVAERFRRSLLEYAPGGELYDTRHAEQQST
jgi:hypothetical protein